MEAATTASGHLKPDHYGNSTLSRAIPSGPPTPRRAKKKRHFTPFSKPLQIRWALYSQSGRNLRAGRQNSKQGKKTFQILHHFGGVGAENFHTQIRAQKTTRDPRSLIFRSFPLFSAIPRFQYHLLNIIAPLPPDAERPGRNAFRARTRPRKSGAKKARCRRKKEGYSVRIFPSGPTVCRKIVSRRDTPWPLALRAQKELARGIFHTPRIWGK